MADFQDLLVKTSRTFALSIPLLEEPTRRQVGLAYLLFRIADTFEDAWMWPRRKRIEALQTFSRWLDGDTPKEEIEAQVEHWLTPAPSEHRGYLELIKATGDVIEAHLALEPAARASIEHHVKRTALGMADFVRRTDDRGQLRLRDLDDLRQYCYVVAGIVGEMLTDLFVLGSRGANEVAAQLTERAAAFGEALQLVNILKDAADDEVEGRTYIPPQLERAQVLALARRDLEIAVEYVEALERAHAPRGFIGFTALPVELAWATLERVETEGPGAKVPREQVMSIVGQIHQALEQGKSAVRAR